MLILSPRRAPVCKIPRGLAIAGFLKTITKHKNIRFSDYTNALLPLRQKMSVARLWSIRRNLQYQYYRLVQQRQGYSANTRHFDATVCSKCPKGLRTILPPGSSYRFTVSVCKRELTVYFCVHGLYDRHTLSDGEIKAIVGYLEKDNWLKEVLITGGNPLLFLLRNCPCSLKKSVGVPEY